MIVVTVDKERISILGHSGYAEPGEDIICSAVSALFQTLVFSLEELTKDTARYEIQYGNSIAEYRNLSEKGQLLVDSFFLGICAIVNGYPDYIRIA